MIVLFTLILCAVALSFATPAHASGDSGDESLSVDAVWLEGDMLHIEVTDKQTGINQTLELSLTDYAGNSEYVSVQAVDRNGNKSNTIQFKNPFYIPETEADVSNAPTQSESSVPDGAKPLTPDGSGTVLDNVTDGDGKEFFTITTEDGSVFYMIIDRQRSSDNVYLLNAVTDDDLAALAQKNGKSASAVPTEQIPPQTTAPFTTQEPEPTEPPPSTNRGINNGTIIFIVIAAAAVGGIGYYFKIVRPKQQASDSADEGDDNFEDDDDYGDEDYGGDGDTE